MAQYGRPDSDITQSNWSGGYGTIDEASYSDADYITGSSSANGTAEYGLSNVTDPVSSSTHVVRFRAWQQNNSHQRTLVASLYQGTTLISSYNGGVAFNLVKGTATAYSWTLSSGEADAITDYSDLRVRFVSGGTVGTPAGSRSAVYVSWSELEVPDASGSTYNESISLGRSGGVSEGDALTAVASISLGRSAGLSLANVMDLVAALSLARTHGLSSSNTLDTAGAISLVQSKGSIVIASDSGNLSFDATPTVGNLILVAVSSWQGDLGTGAVTDNQGNTYTRRPKQEFATDADVAIFSAIASTASGTFTITVNPTGASCDFTFSIAEFSGVNADPFDGQTSGTGTGTSVSSGSLLPSVNNCLWVGAMTHGTTDTSIQETNGTLIYENQGGSSNMPLSFVYKVQTTAASEAATWTIGASATWGAVIASFKPASGGTVYNESITLAKSAALNQVNGMDMVAALNLGRSAGISDSGNLVMEAGISLSKVSGVADAGGMDVFDTVSLAKGLGLGTLSGMSMSDAIALGRSLGLTDANRLDAVGAVSLGRSQALSDSNSLIAQAAVQLSRTHGVSLATALEILTAISLAESLGLGAVGGTTLNDAVALARVAGLTTLNIISKDEAISLVRNAGVSAGNSLDAANVINLEKSAGVGTVESLDAVAVASLAKSLGLNPESSASLGANLTLAKSLAATMAAALEINTSIALGMVLTALFAGSEGTQSPTPAWRIYVEPGEGRVYMATGEARVHVVGSSRNIYVINSGRTHTPRRS